MAGEREDIRLVVRLRDETARLTALLAERDTLHVETIILLAEIRDSEQVPMAWAQKCSDMIGKITGLLMRDKIKDQKAQP